MWQGDCRYYVSCPATCFFSFVVLKELNLVHQNLKWTVPLLLWSQPWSMGCFSAYGSLWNLTLAILVASESLCEEILTFWCPIFDDEIPCWLCVIKWNINEYNSIVYWFACHSCRRRKTLYYWHTKILSKFWPKGNAESISDLLKNCSPISSTNEKFWVVHYRRSQANIYF